MSLQTRIGDLITAIGTDYKQLRTWMFGSSTGDLSSLTTTDKASLVAAINETKAGNSGAPPAASETVAGVVELATTTEATTGTDTVRAVTPAGLAAGLAALVAAAPGTLDTLDELAAAIGDDPNFASTLATSLAGKQPLDSDLTAIAALTSAANKVLYSTGTGTWALADFTAAGRALVDDADAAAQRTTLSVYSQAELGNFDTDLAALYTTAKT